MADYSRLLPNRYSWTLVIFQLCFAAYLIFFITPSGFTYYLLHLLMLFCVIASVVQTRREWSTKRWKTGRVRVLVGGLMLLCLSIYLFAGIAHAQQIRLNHFAPSLLLLTVLAAPPIICFAVCLAAEYVRRPANR